MLTTQVIGQADPPGKTVEGETQIIRQMIARLQSASAGGWGKYPIVPQPLITVPEEQRLSDELTVIVWPEPEYNEWVSAWDYLAGDVLRRLGTLRKFPLGDRALAMEKYDVAKQDLGMLSIAARSILNTFPTVNDGLDGAIAMLTELKPTKPAKKKPLISSAALISFLLAAVAGGAILYYYRRREQGGAVPAPTESMGWY